MDVTKVRGGTFIRVIYRRFTQNTDNFIEAGELLEQLPWPRMILDGILVNNDDLERARWRAAPAGASGARLVEASATHRGGYAPERDPGGRDLATRPQ